MKRPTIICLCLIGAAALGAVFPPFHIRSLKARQAAQSPTNAASAGQIFWNTRLLSACAQAAEATEVIKLIGTNPQQVRPHFGRTVEMGDSYYLFLRGTGRVVGASKDSIDLAVAHTDGTVDISVQLGPVFGNAVRDGTGLLSASDYPNSQAYNELAATLNQMVETNVLPTLQRLASVGKSVQFAGCVEVADEATDLKPLKLVPVFIKAE